MELIAPSAAERAFWRERRVLVTGATGLVGAWVCHHLIDRGALVVALVRDPDRRSELFRAGLDRRCAVVAGQLEEYAAVERAVAKHEVDTVVHLAAQPIVQIAERAPLATFEANIRGTYHLLEACRVHAGQVTRVVVASSDKAYGDHGGAAYREDGALSARHPYDVSKACADLLAQSYAHTYDLPIAIARCGNIYGGGDLNWSRIVPGTIRAIERGERPVLRSDGTARRDYVYVRDVAHAYALLAARAADPEVRGQAFNFSCEAPISALGMVGRIAAAMGRPEVEPVIANSARHEIPHQAVSAARARAVLGWSPAYDLDAGLAETAAWYRAFLRDERAAHAGAT